MPFNQGVGIFNVGFVVALRLGRIFAAPGALVGGRITRRLLVGARHLQPCFIFREWRVAISGKAQDGALRIGLIQASVATLTGDGKSCGVTLAFWRSVGDELRDAGRQSAIALGGRAHRKLGLSGRHFNRRRKLGRGGVRPRQRIVRDEAKAQPVLYAGVQLATVSFEKVFFSGGKTFHVPGAVNSQAEFQAVAGRRDVAKRNVRVRLHLGADGFKRAVQLGQVAL